MQKKRKKENNGRDGLELLNMRLDIKAQAYKQNDIGKKPMPLGEKQTRLLLRFKPNFFFTPYPQKGANSNLS